MAENSRLITDEIRKFIGTVSQPKTACVEVSKSEIRRFMQAIPDEDPVYFDEERAQNSRFGHIVAPPTLPQVIVGLRAPGVRDPLIDMPDDWGGDSPADGDETDASNWYPGMVEMIAQFPENMRFFHGGDNVEVHQLAQPGDIITCVSKVVDMYEKSGRSGQLGFVVMEFTYQNQRGEILCVNRHTEVLRESKKEALP